MGEAKTHTKTRTVAEKGAVQHLCEALEEEGVAEKEFHIKQALQLLDVNAVPSDD